MPKKKNSYKEFFYFFKLLIRTINGNISRRPNNIPILNITLEKSLNIAKLDRLKQRPTLAKVEKTALIVVSNGILSKLTKSIILMIKKAYKKRKVQVLLIVSSSTFLPSKVTV